MANGRGGIQVIPTLNRFAGLQQGALNFVGGLERQFQNQQQLSDNQALIQFIQARQQGLTPEVPQFQTPQGAAGFAGFLGQQPTRIEQQQAQATLGLTQARTQALAAPKPLATSFQQVPDPVTGEITNALINTQTGNIIKSFGATEALTSKDKIQIAVTQAKEFRADPRIQNLQIVERSERGMQAALRQSTSPNVKSRIASDQTLGVLFQKMLDPTSVVRESEFARTPEGAALTNRLVGAAEQLVKGGLKLTNEDRNALVAMAVKLLNETKITANRAFSEFETRADEIGLNKRVIFGGAKPFSITESLPAQPGGVKNVIQQNLGLAPPGNVGLFDPNGRSFSVPPNMADSILQRPGFDRLSPQKESRRQELLRKRDQ